MKGLDIVGGMAPSAARRVLRLGSVARKVGLDVAIAASRRHALPSVLAFLKAGGTLYRGQANLEGYSFEAYADVLGGLGHAAEIIRAGGSIVETNNGALLVSVPPGISFDLTDCDPADALHLIAEQFVRQQYSRLPIRGNVVVDIGTNIGDSALYFAAQGARHVYAFEPFSHLANAARRNIRLNRLEDSVTLVQAGVSAADATVVATFDPFYSSRLTIEDRLSSRMRYSRHAHWEVIRSIALSTILDGLRSSHPRVDIAIKMDCEGSEFEIFSGMAGTDLFRGVIGAVVEYHGGTPGQIPDFMRSAGFEVDLESDASGVGLINAFRANRAVY